MQVKKYYQFWTFYQTKNWIEICIVFYGSDFSRKPGDYNGTSHYFWDWYHEKLIPNQFMFSSNLTVTQIFWLFLLFWFTVTDCEAELRVLWVQQKRSVILVLTLAKNVNFKLSGDEFFMMTISKIIVPL